MAQTPLGDPSAIWGDLISQWEKSFNSFANETMGSGEFGRYMNQTMNMTLKMQTAMGEMMSKYLKAMNLPSREEVVKLDKRLHAIEQEMSRIASGLDRLTRTNYSSSETSFVPRPPRTKKPPAGE